MMTQDDNIEKTNDEIKGNEESVVEADLIEQDNTTLDVENHPNSVVEEEPLSEDTNILAVEPIMTVSSEETPVDIIPDIPPTKPQVEEEQHHAEKTPQTVVNNTEETEDETELLDYDTFTKAELTESIEQIVQNTDITLIKNKISLIKLAFINLLKEEKESRLTTFIEEGGDKDDFKIEADELENRFNKAFDIYKKNKKEFEKALEEEKNKNFEQKKLILEEIRKLIESEDELKHTYDAFKRLQAEWKEIGQVPRQETNNLWQSYHFLVEKFLDKVRINEELRDLDRKKNLEAALDLCEKAEELLINPQINQSFKLLQQYHNDWKEIGLLPTDKKDEVWERFKQASDNVIQRRHEFYEKLKEEQDNNYAAKVVLCEKMEDILKENIISNSQWQEAFKKTQELQDLWKTIGRAPAKKNDEVWKRFRTAINLLYENKKDFYDKIKDELINNYNLKIDLCVQAESLKDNQDWKRTTNEFLNLQAEWKKIGTVPRKHSDDIWKRFRGACDYFFKRKSEYFSNIKEREQENLKLKLDIINKVKAAKIEGDKKTILETLKAFQREFTDIGYVPMSEKENIQNQMRDAINKKFDELKINPSEKNILSYATKFEHIKEDPASRDIIKNELRILNNKITQLRSDIQLWENNIGFFANSKSANVLKLEFENKIQKAKEDIQVLEEKVKFLNKR